MTYFMKPDILHCSLFLGGRGPFEVHKTDKQAGITIPTVVRRGQKRTRDYI